MAIGRSDLIGQFILCQNEAAVPDGWLVRTHGDWCLGYHPSLPVCDIRDHEGTEIGWLFGYVVSPAGSLMDSDSGRLSLPYAAETVRLLQALACPSSQ